MASNSILAKMAVLISANTAEFNKALSQSNNQMKSFQNGFKGLAASVGVGFGLAGLIQGFKGFTNIIGGFEASMSEVKAITGATGVEFQRLEKDALALGRTTKFTAKEVSQLQVAYGRLGFTTKEILAATKATVLLATATGEDLAKSADVAGSTVRGFGLSADETGRVVDVMAASFNKTALGLENFTESMKYVAPIANAANVSVEETTSLLGVLADAGIRGSQAGTSLRKIFGDLTKDGRPLNERLDELAKKGITLSDSYDEVGRTAQTALLVISKNRDKTNELTQAFTNASGEAEKMAKIMADNLQGDVTKLSSAWEALILSVGNTAPIRAATQFLTGLLNALNPTAETSDILRQALKRLNFELDYYKGATKDSNPEAFKLIGQQIEYVAKQAELLGLKLVKLTDPSTGVTKYMVDLRTPLQGVAEDFTKVTQALAPMLGLIPALEEKIKSFREKQRGAFTATDVLKYGVAIRVLSGELKNLMSGQDGTDVKKKFNVVDAILPPDSMKQLEDRMNALIGKLAQKGTEVKAVAQKLQIELGSLVASAANEFGTLIGNMIAGISEFKTFGDGFAAILAGMMVQIGQAMIAFGTAGIAALQLAINPFAAVAAGIALVALGTALRGSIKTITRGGSGGSRNADSGVSRASSVMDMLGNRIILSGSVNVTGTQMEILLTNQNRVNNRTKVGGLRLR